MDWALWMEELLQPENVSDVMLCESVKELWPEWRVCDEIGGEIIASVDMTRKFSRGVSDVGNRGNDPQSSLED